MRANAVILVIIGLLLLVGTAGAVITVQVSGNQSWLVAGSGASAAYTVNVKNTTSGSVPIDGASITFSVDPLYGAMSPTNVTTNSAGQAFSTFTVNTKSGTAPINAYINYTGSNGPFNMIQTIPQNIDHNISYYSTFTYPLSGTVASEVHFNVSLTDQYYNPIDNRRGNHIINLHVHGPAPDNCSFNESGFAHDISPSLDAFGNTSVHVKLTTKIGDNNILMDEYGSIPNQLEWITAVATGAPVDIKASVSPSGSPPTLPADGKSVFNIIFSLIDIYGNPTNGQYIWVNTSVKGEEKLFSSNSLGQVLYPYGPRDSIGEIYIQAISNVSPTVNSTRQMVKFRDTGAAIISLTADPSMMPSHDVSSSTPVSDIIATVVDKDGNAHQGATVNFTLGSETYEGTYNVTVHPSLSSTSNISNEFGQAIVQFTPGSFTTKGNPGFNASATGHCNVIATWNGTQKIVPLTWKNYPFLSVSTSVDPDTVPINSTINVSIVFRGDGWAFTQPSDIVLVTDLSGTMSLNSPTKLSGAKTALKKFVGLSGGKLPIALASYSDAPDEYSTEAWQLWNIQKNNASAKPFNPYGSIWGRTLEIPTSWDSWGYSDAKIDRDFTTVSSDLNDTINLYGANGGTCIGCGLSAAQLEFNTKGDPTHPKVIILMTDGIATMAPINSTFPLKAYMPSDWVSDRSTIGKTAAINIASTLKGQNIKIYTIGFGSDADTATLTAIASPGCDYIASDNTALSDVYAAIYAKVSDPGVDTQMTVDFQNINVTQVTIPGADVYNYVPSTKIGWQNGTVSYKDQTSDWSDYQLEFNIGTIKLKEQWNTTFKLRVNQSGLIEVFGNNSHVTFNGGTQTLYLPQTFITVVPNLDILNITAKNITLKNLKLTGTGEIKTLLPVTWDTKYTGNKTLTEKVYYQIDGGPWVLFDTKTHPYDPLTMNYVEFAQLDVTKLPPGGYLIKVYATASDAPDATITLDNSVNVGNRGRTFIKLQ